MINDDNLADNELDRERDDELRKAAYDIIIGELPPPPRRPLLPL